MVAVAVDYADEQEAVEEEEDEFDKSEEKRLASIALRGRASIGKKTAGSDDDEENYDEDDEEESSPQKQTAGQPLPMKLTEPKTPPPPEPRIEIDPNATLAFTRVSSDAKTFSLVNGPMLLPLLYQWIRHPTNNPLSFKLRL